MSVAASLDDVPAMINAIVAMILMIVFLDQLLWRPLIVWSQKLRVEETAPTTQTESWFFNILKNSYCIAFLRALFQRVNRAIQDRKARNAKRDYGELGPDHQPQFSSCILLVAFDYSGFFCH